MALMDMLKGMKDQCRPLSNVEKMEKKLYGASLDIFKFLDKN